MAGDERTGVTIHRTIAALDAGPIAAQEAFAVGPDDDAGCRLRALRGDRRASCSTRCWRSPSRAFAPQPERRRRPTPRRSDPADRELDLARPARELVDRVRALSPHIGARAVVDGRPLIVWKARAAADGSLELLEVQPEGGRRMSYDEFLRGLR